MYKPINVEALHESCDRIAQKDIRFEPNGNNWRPWKYFTTAMRAFDGHPAVESIALECGIYIEGEIIPGIVMMHRDGRVYPMSRDTYNRIYE